jgi:hypothetical protein
MKKYIIEFCYISEVVKSGEVAIEANSEEEARKLAEEMDAEGELDDLSGHEEVRGTDFHIENIGEQ